MAEVGHALRAFLVLDPTVASLFNNSDGSCRIFIDYVENQQSVPYAKIATSVSSPLYSHDGRGNSKELIQIDVYDDDEPGAVTAADAIRSALDGYRGMLSDLRAGFVFVRVINGNWSTDVRLFRKILEVQLGTERNS